MAIVALEHYYPGFKASKASQYDLSNFDVVAKGDQKVGSVSDILVDDSSREIRYLAISKAGLLSQQKVLMPVGLGTVIYMDRRVYIEDLTKDQVNELPEFGDDQDINSEYLEQLEDQISRFLADNGDIKYQSIEKEPYFYTLKNDKMKAIQAQLTNHRESH